MVGFKSLSLIFTLLLLAACVPQTKQTQCGSDEAFSASLRQCVPVVPGPSAFLSLENPIPTGPIAKYKDDIINMTFSVSIKNPYAQSYTVQWERIYAGITYPVTPTTSISWSFAPALFSTQLGIHVISVKLKDATGVIVDTQAFQLTIVANPTPVILTSTVNPPSYAITYTPVDPVATFSFNTSNNGQPFTSGDYLTDWTLYKNGVNLTAFNQTDILVVATGNGVNTMDFDFDPADVSLGVGGYILRARVRTTSMVIVAEQQWSITVQHPSLAPVISRNIYSGSAVPAFSTVTNAYNGVAYTSSATYNFIPLGQATQANFCVTTSNQEGTYAGDGYFIRVDFYLDGSTLVYSANTSASTRVCLSDAAGAVLNTVLFNNTSSTVTQGHTIVARVTDERTGVEYSASNMNASLGTYPITWNLSVKPTNVAPTVTFTANANLANITCNPAVTTSRTCAVTQDQTFTLGISATDDFYSTSSTTDTEQDKFTYTMVLYRNGSAISTCSKTIANVSDGNAVNTDYVGPDYLCSFNIASYDAGGNVNPASYAYSVSIIFSDVGSPISGSTALAGNTITYNLNVAEANTAPAIDPQGITVADSYLANSAAPAVVIQDSASADYLTEGDILRVSVLVTDAERDDHQVNVYLCTDFTSACATSSIVGSQTVNKTDNALTTATVLNYSIPENLVPVATAIGTDYDTFFKVIVTDVPDTIALALTAATSAVAPVHFNLNIRNKNPAPQFGGTPSPALATALKTMVGFPLTLDPGTVTDASLFATENTISYQWFIDETGGDNGYTAIPGATSRILKWTPSNGLAGTAVNLQLCVSDGTAVNPIPADAAVAAAPYNQANGTNCLAPWTAMTAQKNSVPTAYTGTAGVDLTADMAVWQDTTVALKRIIYSAYADAAGDIYIEKTVFDANGVIYNDNATGFQTVKLCALAGVVGACPGVAAGSVKDISIGGNSEFLYIAYQAAASGTPSSPKIRVRRIDKRTGVLYGSKTDTSFPDTGKFGFRYAQNLPTTTSPNVTVNAVVAGLAYTIDFTGAMIAAELVTINTVGVSASDTPTASQLCSGGSAGCSAAGNATKLASIINSSNSRLLQGLTAVASGTQVSIYGDVGGESLDANATVSNYIVGKLGKIIVDAANWYLPFVDLSTSGTLSMIRLLSAPSLAASYLSTVAVTDSVVYNAIGAVSTFENDLAAGNMLIGSVNTSSVAKLHVYTLAGVIGVNATLFGGAPISANTLRIAPRVAGNPYYYAAAKVLTTVPSTYEWKIGRYDASMVVSLENKFSTLSHNAASATVLGDSNITELRITALPSTASTTEARLMVASTNGTATDNLYLVRLRTDNDLSCDLCVPVNFGAREVSPTKKVAITPIDVDMTIGTAGATASENQKDVFFGAWAFDIAASGFYTPHIGIFNAEVETISSTTTSTSGTTGNRASFFGPN